MVELCLVLRNPCSSSSQPAKLANATPVAFDKAAVRSKSMVAYPSAVGLAAAGPSGFVTAAAEAAGAATVAGATILVVVVVIVRCGDSGKEARDPSGELACNPPPVVVVVTDAVVVESDPLSKSKRT